MKPAKHRKLFYVPGMISLVLVPILCFWFINSGNYLKKEYSVEVGLADSFMKFNYSDPLRSTPIYPKRRNFNFILNGNQEADRRELKKARFRIKKMLTEKDSIHAVKIFLGKKATYQQFIDVIDCFAIDKVPSYLIKDNYLYAVYFPPERKLKKVKNFTCGGLGNDMGIDYNYLNNIKKEEQRAILIQSIKKFWPVPLALFGIIMLNIYMLIKFNKNRIYNQKWYI
jgi:hypothetical protein